MESEFIAYTRLAYADADVVGLVSRYGGLSSLLDQSILERDGGLGEAGTRQNCCCGFGEQYFQWLRNLSKSLFGATGGQTD